MQASDFQTHSNQIEKERERERWEIKGGAPEKGENVREREGRGTKELFCSFKSLSELSL